MQNLWERLLTEGGAAGKFAIDNRPLGTTLEAGHFTATATLTADFDENVAGEAGNSISGTVDQFVANDVERPGWEVTLGATDIAFGDANTDHFSLDVPDDPVTDTDNTDNTANLWMIDDVPGVLSGNWRGNFYNDGDARNDGTPEVVIGTFSVSHGKRRRGRSHDRCLPGAQQPRRYPVHRQLAGGASWGGAWTPPQLSELGVSTTATPSDHPFRYLKQIGGLSRKPRV